MPLLTDTAGRQYRLLTPRSEKAFEARLTALADQVFGPRTIFITRKRKLGGKQGIVGIPDGYLFDFADPSTPRLFIVEVELHSHDLFKHITEQLVRFAAGFERDKIAVRDFLHREIQASAIHRARLVDAQKHSDLPNVDAMLNKAIFAQFAGLVVIDERSEELDRVLKQFVSSISVLEVRTWRAADGTELQQFETLYDEDEPPEVETQPAKKGPSNDESMARRQRRARCDTVVVPAKADGFQQVFVGQNRWYAIRISPGMRERIRFVAAYQVAPLSAVTHIAEVSEIRPHGSEGKYELVFAKPAEPMPKVPMKNRKVGLYGPAYVRRADLVRAKFLEDALA